jgi:hypothetical protein
MCGARGIDIMQAADDLALAPAAANNRHDEYELCSSPASST